MKIVLKVVPAVAAVMLMMACGDDDGEGDSNGAAGRGGGTGGSGGTNAAQCKGVYRAWTQMQLESATEEGACEGETAEVCGRDVNTEAGVCGQTCYGMNPEEAAVAACTLDCLKTQYEATAPSDACLGCYLQSVNCVRINCLADCLADPASAACGACRLENGCTSEFFECSGLPNPAAPPAGEGGTSG